MSIRRLDIIQASRRKLWYRMLRFFLCFFDVDVYELTKLHESSQSKNRSRRPGESLHANHPIRRYSFHVDSELNLSPESKFPHAEVGKTHRNFAKLLIALSGYCCLRAAMICVVHYSLLRHDPSISRSKELPFLSLELAEKLAQFLGNPLYPLKDVGLLLYIGPCGYVFLSLSMISTYYKSQPMDNAPLRFLLDPQKELKRVNAAIRFKLTKIRASFNIYRLHLKTFLQDRIYSIRLGTLSSNKNRRASMRGHQSEIECEEESFCNEIEATISELTSQPSAFKSLKPEVFSLKYYKKISSQMQSVLFTFLAAYTMSVAVINGNIWLPVYYEKCSQISCRVFHVFSFSELLMVAELVIMLVVVVILATYNTFILVLVIMNQLELIKLAKKELTLCLDKLMAFNRDGIFREEDDFKLTPIRKPMAQPHGEKRSDWRERNKLQGFMLRSLTKLLICDDEMAQNTHCISLEIFHQFYFVICIIFMLAMNGQFKDPSTYFMKYHIVTATWFNVNLIAISCAYINARVLEFKRTLWSISSASVKLHNDCYYEWLPGPEWFSGRFAYAKHLSVPTTKLHSKRGFRCCTFVNEMWRRFIYSSNINSTLR